MKAENVAERRRSRRAPAVSRTMMVKELLSRDLFSTIRTDRQLSALEKEVTRRHGEPYMHLLNALLGTGSLLTERAARSVWRSIVEHRGRIRGILGRNLPLRAAAIDWLALQDETKQPFKAVIVSHTLLESAIDEGRHDPITRLPTRRFFEEILAGYLKTTPFQGGSLVFLDMDGFKAVNDRLGHARGDWVLREFAATAAASLRSSDLLGRVGGDEFALLLAGVQHADARRIVHRLRAVFEERSSPTGVSFSFGVARLRADESSAAVMKRADRAMYRDKKARKAAQARRVRRAGATGGRAAPGREPQVSSMRIGTGRHA